MPLNSIHKQSWYPLFVAFLCMLIIAASNGMTTSGLSVFDEALLREFGWTVGQLKFRESINFLGAAMLVVLAGFFVDRVGFKPLLLLGLAILAVSYVSYGFVQNLPQVYGVHLLMAMVLACAGNMVAVITAASTMPDRRGLAVGIAVAGSSVGGIVLPPVAVYLNKTLGWREAMQVEALIPVFILIAVALLLKNRIVEKPTASSPQSVEGVTFAHAVRSPQFYLIAIAAGLTFYSVIALFAHIFLYMRSLEFTPQSAALAISAFSLAALSGKLGSGWLSDFVNPIVLLRNGMFLMLLGLLGVFYAPNFIWIFLLMTGLGWGGLHTLYNYVLLALFGMRAAGKINATVSIAQSTGAGLGAAATGFLFDMRGDYSLAFLVVVVCMTVGLLLTLAVRPLDGDV